MKDVTKIQTFLDKLYERKAKIDIAMNELRDMPIPEGKEEVRTQEKHNLIDASVLITEITTDFLEAIL